MPLTGQAKTDYQREYMRRRRSKLSVRPEMDNVRPIQPEPVRPVLTVRERMKTMTVPEIEAEFSRVPNWRREIG